MGVHTTCLNIFLSFLLILLVILHSSNPKGADAEGSGVRKLGNKIWQQVQSTTAEITRGSYKNILKVNSQSEQPDSHEPHLSSLADQIDPSLQIFFRLNDIKAGITIPVYFTRRSPSNTPRFLPQQEADSIPFSSTQLPYLLDLFSIGKDSPQAKAIADTLKHCEFEPLKGEIKFCATSLESLLNLTHNALGNTTPVRLLTTTYLTNSTTQFQNYTFLEDAKEILADKVMGCHPMPYPYAVFYCHCQAGGNRLFKAPISGDDGERVDAVGICHMDTSLWDPNHVAFRVLGVGPGKAPVCHFFPADNLVWVPAKALS